MIDLLSIDYAEDIREIGAVADTHIPTRARSLPPKLFSELQSVELILHAGDLVDQKVISELQALAPVEAVAGNMDPPELQTRLGRFKLIRIGSISIGLMHGDHDGRRLNYERAISIFSPVRPDAVVFGHQHVAVLERYNDVLFMNPGSAADPRRSSRRSCGRLTVAGSRLTGEIVYL